MELVFVENDILEEQTDVLCHQVNCMGKMGAGLALQIRNRYPVVYNKYTELCEKYYYSPRRMDLLGKAQFISVGGYKICNLFGQFYYGHNHTFTSRDALVRAIKNAMWKLSDNKQPFTISIPCGMGCGFGGDNWEELQPIIVQTFANAEAKYRMNITLKIVRRI